MQNTAKFNIYASSAGSGKTFTLTKEYLKLALRSDQDYYFKRILAITFTNDAAHEMKERILAALKDFAANDFDSTKRFWGMAQQILAEDPQLNFIKLQQRSLAVLNRILQDYADFSVRTIDSFVNQLVAAFTEDLGLPFNYEIVLDKDLVLLEAAENLIEKAGRDTQEELTQILEEFVLSKAEEGKNWNLLADELADFGKNELNDLHYADIIKLKDLAIKDYRQIQKQLNLFQEASQKNTQALALQAIRLIEDHGLSSLDFKNGDRGGIGKYFYDLCLNIEKLFEDPNTIHRKAIENDDWYSQKTPLPIKTSIDAISEELKQIYLQIQVLKEQVTPKYLLYNSILPHITKMALLSKIKDEFDTILQEKNQVFIAEFNRKILQVVLSEPVPFIYERIGEKFNHLLIDEFQDTSEMQFYNLLPLIENSLAKNHFNLIVGDAKQSIYRWRGGKMELLVYLFKNNISQLAHNNIISDFQLDQFSSIAAYIKPEALNTNYRSTQEIIGFNNEFFEHIVALEKENYKFLAQVYDDTFAQKIPMNAPTGGQVAIDFLEADLMLENLQAIIEKAIIDGYNAGDIAILTRANRTSAIVANHLKNLGYNIVSRDSLLLKNSVAIRLLIAWIRVLNYSDNLLAKYEVMYLFHQIVLAQTPDNHTNNEIKSAINNSNTQAFFEYFKRLGYTIDYEALQRASLYEIIEKLCGELKLFEKAKEQEYIFRFLDLALDFGQKQSNHLQDFLQYWENNKEKLSVKSADGQNAITITTIHRAKGLEYPVVIIPYANWDMQPRWSNTFWADISPLVSEYKELKTENQKSLHATPLFYTKDLSKTAIAPQYDEELQAHFLENLNMLYVAFTRPIDKLFVLATRTWDNRTQKYKYKGVAELLVKYLSAKGIYNDEIATYDIAKGSKTIIKHKGKLETNKIILNKIISEDRSERLRLRRSADKIFDTNDARNKSKDMGNKVHAAFEKIIQKSDVGAVIRQLVDEGIINISEKDEIEQSIQQVLRLSEISPLFEPNLRVITEKEILFAGEVLRPDRVVLKNNIAYIIDYKTGTPRESHQTQIQQYANLYRQMGYDNIKTMLVYLETATVITEDLRF